MVSPFDNGSAPVAHRLELPNPQGNTDVEHAAVENNGSDLQFASAALMAIPKFFLAMTQNTGEGSAVNDQIPFGALKG